MAKRQTKEKTAFVIQTRCKQVFVTSDGENFLEESEAKNHQFNLDWKKIKPNLTKDLWIALGLPSKPYLPDSSPYDLEEEPSTDALSKKLTDLFDDEVGLGTLFSDNISTFTDIVDEMRWKLLPNMKRLSIILEVFKKYGVVITQQ